MLRGAFNRRKWFVTDIRCKEIFKKNPYLQKVVDVNYVKSYKWRLKLQTCEMLFTKLLLEKSFLRILGFQRWTRRTRDRQILAKVEVLVNAVATSYKIINWKFLPSLTNNMRTLHGSRWHWSTCRSIINHKDNHENIDQRYHFTVYIVIC